MFNDRMVLRFDPERHAHHSRRHAFARPGPRHRLCADGQRMARRAVRECPLRAGRHRRGADRARQLWLAQHACRRQRAQKRRRQHHRESQADGGDDAGSRRRRYRVQGRFVPHRRHRPRHAADQCREVVLPAGDAAAAIRRRPGSLRHLRRRAAELSERLPCLRGRGRSGNRLRHARPLRRGRRCRQGDESRCCAKARSTAASRRAPARR